MGTAVPKDSCTLPPTTVKSPPLLLMATPNVTLCFSSGGAQRDRVLVPEHSKTPDSGFLQGRRGVVGTFGHEGWRSLFARELSR